MLIAQDSSHPVELRLEALAGVRQTEADPWPPGALDGYHSIILDRSIAFDDRLQAAQACSAFGDPLEDDRKLLFREMLDIPDLPPHLVFVAANAIGGPVAVERLAGLLDTPGQIGDLARERLKSVSKSKRWPKGVRRMAKAALGSQGVRPAGHVFVSYVREDAPGVGRLIDDLQSMGIPIWRDTDKLRPGERWRAAIAQAIEEGDAFLAVFSAASEERDRSYMREELVRAVEELRLRPHDRAWFFPVLLSDCDVPRLPIGAGETLHDLQYVSLAGDWDSGVHALALALTKAVTRIPAG